MAEARPGIRRVILAVRQSPDWGALAADAERGRDVPPERYLPPAHIPGFPADLPALIRRWDETFAVGFFRVRAELKAIAAGTLARVAGATVLRANEVEALAGELRRAGDAVVFFLDDDDWFAPDTLARLRAVLVGDEDVAVFPMVRLEQESFTFLRELTDRSVVVGRPAGFATRYQTNNYGLLPRVLRAHHLRGLRDHLLASQYGARMGLRDHYYHTLLSATNKTPASASLLERLATDPRGARAMVLAYVAHLRGLAIPDGAAWMRGPIGETAALFDRAAG